MATKGLTEDDVVFFNQQNESLRSKQKFVARPRHGPEESSQEVEAKASRGAAEVVLPAFEWPSSSTITLFVAGACIGIGLYLIFSRGQSEPLRKLTFDDWKRMSEMMSS